MTVIGEEVKLLSASDPTLAGKTGTVVLETARTLVLRSMGRNLRIQKQGTALMLMSTGRIVAGLDIAGRLQDRIGRRSL